MIPDQQDNKSDVQVSVMQGMIPDQDNKSDVQVSAMQGMIPNIPDYTDTYTPDDNLDSLDQPVPSPVDDNEMKSLYMMYYTNEMTLQLETAQASAQASADLQTPDLQDLDMTSDQQVQVQVLDRFAQQVQMVQSQIRDPAPSQIRDPQAAQASADFQTPDLQDLDMTDDLQQI